MLVMILQASQAASVRVGDHHDALHSRLLACRGFCGHKDGRRCRGEQRGQEPLYPPAVRWRTRRYRPGRAILTLHPAVRTS